mmetsp:Transcript_56410/g.97126  ORF Transcript_56410/g.97126 Transcript_56410/m.97126 type:complete len:234 (+) Transcript_56410:458-1159(+)
MYASPCCRAHSSSGRDTSKARFSGRVVVLTSMKMRCRGAFSSKLDCSPPVPPSAALATAAAAAVGFVMATSNGRKLSPPPFTHSTCQQSSSAPSASMRSSPVVSVCGGGRIRIPSICRIPLRSAWKTMASPRTAAARSLEKEGPSRSSSSSSLFLPSSARRRPYSKTPSSTSACMVSSMASPSSRVASATTRHSCACSLLASLPHMPAEGCSTKGADERPLINAAVDAVARGE